MVGLRAKSIALPAVLLAAAGWLATALPGSADPKEPQPVRVTLYDRDPDHLWNRVHAALFVRTGPDSHLYGEDRLEPLLWEESECLLKGMSADRAVAVLEEFVREKGESRIDDPLKRAVFQRDLWLVFNWLAAGHGGIATSPAHKRLAAPLAAAIRKLALTPEQVAKLPDNYTAAAVASRKYAERFDPEHPDRPYLPPDLFQADGPWVCFGRTDAPPASLHIAEGGTNRFTNSVFLVFLKVPGGRDRALDWLKRMAAFGQPLLLKGPADKRPRREPAVPNPAVPQLPKGTEVALVRRALLVDSRRRVIASPLTEGVQLRVMRADSSGLTADDLDFASTPDHVRRALERQAYFEFQLRRAALFANEAGGLRDVSAERDFKTGFASHQWDEFERPTNDQPFLTRAQPTESNRQLCFGCHSAPGVQGLQSLHRMRAEGEDEDARRPRYPLVATPVAEFERAMVRWKDERPGWKALRGLLPE